MTQDSSEQSLRLKGGEGGVQLIDELDDSCVIRAYINQSVWYHPVGHIPHFGSYFFLSSSLFLSHHHRYLSYSSYSNIRHFKL